jgi:hypothetical protein
MNRLLKYITILLLLIVVTNAYSQDIKFTASTSHNTVKTGDRFQIEFTVNTTISNFKPPKLSNFRVLSGPNQSTNMSWVNGKTTHTISYSYVLMATKEGEFTIGPAKGIANGKAYATNSLKITVGKGVKVQQNPHQGNSNTNKQANVSDDLYIKSSVNKTKVHQGEQIIATYQLYTRVNISGNELVKNADLNGFWSQEIDLGQSQWKQEIIGGYRWNVAAIRKIVLFPQRSGNLEIDPLEMKFIVQRRAHGRGHSVFDQFFGKVENIEYNLKSKPIKIKVLPYPTPSPVGFNGTVGKFDMKMDVSANEIKANEAVNIKIKIKGTGNINLIESPKIDFPQDFETYDPKVNDKISTTVSGVSGSREFDYLVIPRHAGKFLIDPISFSYFNSTTKKYSTITTNPIEINVLKSDGSESDNTVYTSVNKEDIKMIGEDIRYIHTNNYKFSHTNEDFYGSWKFYTFLLFAPFLFLLVFVFRNKIREAQSDLVKVKSKKASKIAGKLLNSAKQSLVNKNKTAFYEDISKALFGYIGDKLNIAVAELNQTNIKDRLVKINVNEQTIKELIDTIELCEMARFAPVSTSEQEIYNKAEAIINKIEQEVKK